MNLRSMATMRAAFAVPVGLSDHTLGTHIVPAAVAMGAELVEKHFTLDRSSPGPDHPFAIEPDELRADGARTSATSRRRSATAPNRDRPTTRPPRCTPRRADRWSRPAPSRPGTKITREMLTVKRPGYGIKPKFLDALVGREAAIDIEDDEVITWEMI